jgi:hypothetical protein
MVKAPAHLDKYPKLFEKHLETLDRLQVIVLNGHLIVESAIDNIIALMLFHPEHIQKARLEFGQKVQLARGYALRKNKDGIWGLIPTIGEVRNEVAHNLKGGRMRRWRQPAVDARRFPGLSSSLCATTVLIAS